MFGKDEDSRVMLKYARVQRRHATPKGPTRLGYSRGQGATPLEM